MFLVTRKTDYALVALAHLARRADRWVSAREVATRSGISLAVLTNLLNALAHGGLVTSARGVKGGYRLARSPEDITLADVIQAIEGPARLTVCAASPAEGESNRCRFEEVCVLRGPVRKAHRRLRAFLEGVTLAELAFEAEPCELQTIGADHHAYGNEYDRGTDESGVPVWLRDGD